MTGNTPGMDSGSRTAEQIRWSNYYLMRDLEQAGPAVHLLSPVNYTAPTEYPAATQHHPVDPRSKRDRREDQARFKKAKAYYGKTYVIPRSQLIWALMICIGVALMIAAGSAGVAVWLSRG